MPALAVLVLVAYLLVLAFALAVWAALTLRQRDELGRSAARRDERRIPDERGARPDAATWSPRTAAPPPPQRGITNDDVRGLRASERRNDATWLEAEVDRSQQPHRGRGGAAAESTKARDDEGRAASSEGSRTAVDREKHVESSDPAGRSSERDPDRDPDRNDDAERRRRGEDAFERFLRAESPKR